MDFGADVVREMELLVGGTEKWIALVRPLAADLVALGPAAIAAVGGLIALKGGLAAVSAETLRARTSLSELKAMMASPFKTALLGIGLVETARALGAELGELIYEHSTPSNGPCESISIRKSTPGSRRLMRQSARTIERNKELLKGLRSISQRRTNSTLSTRTP